MERFERDFDSGAYEPAVWSEYQEAHQLGINGVPTIVINDQYAVVGAQPLAAYRQIFTQILTGQEPARA
jgi:predicted DsbA family dithiol-disulfide isomerase